MLYVMARVDRLVFAPRENVAMSLLADYRLTLAGELTAGASDTLTTRAVCFAYALRRRIDWLMN